MLWCCEFEIEYWCRELENTFRKDLLDNALDIMYKKIDRWLLEGEFEKVDKVLTIFGDKKDFLKTYNICGVGLLTITYLALDKLKEREKFFNIMFSIFEELEGKDEARQILIGLDNDNK